jgi:hypothetical protein
MHAHNALLPSYVYHKQGLFGNGVVWSFIRNWFLISVFKILFVNKSCRVVAVWKPVSRNRFISF